jgi:hypothetical protein
MKRKVSSSWRDDGHESNPAPHGSSLISIPLLSPITYDDVMNCFHHDLLTSLNDLQLLFHRHGSTHNPLTSPLHQLKDTHEISSILCDDIFLAQFSLSFYWMIHLRGILSFTTFLSLVSERTILQLLNQLWVSQSDLENSERSVRGQQTLTPPQASSSLMQQEMIQSIILYMFNECIDPNSSFQFAHQLINLLEEFCLPTQRDPDRLNPLPTGGADLRAGDIQKITIVCSVILQCHDIKQVQKFHLRLLFRLLSSRFIFSWSLASSPSSSSEDLNHRCNESFEVDIEMLNNLFSCFGSTLLVQALSFALYHESDSILDFFTYRSMCRTLTLTSAPLLFLVLPSSDSSYSIVRPFTAQCTLDSLLELSQTVFQPIHQEGNATPFLRALCLLEAVGGSSILESWIQRNFKSVSESSSIVDAGEAGLKSSAYMNICLSLCSVTTFMEESTLRSLCQLLRTQVQNYSSDSKYNSCKESLESFLQIARSHLQELDRVGSAISSGDKLYISRNRHNLLPELTPNRLITWATSLQRIGQLPVGISHLCSLLGRNSYKKIFVTMYSLISSDKSLTTYCEILVKAMKENRPPLCPVQEGDEFIRRIKGDTQSSAVESKIAQLLEYINLPNGNTSAQLRNSMVETFRHLLCLVEFISSLPSPAGNDREESDQGDENPMTTATGLCSEDIEQWTVRWKTHCNQSIFNFRTNTNPTQGQETRSPNVSTARSRYIVSLSLLVLQAVEIIYQKLCSNYPSSWNTKTLLSSLHHCERVNDQTSSWLVALAKGVLVVFQLDALHSHSQPAHCRDEMVSSLLTLFHSHFFEPSNNREASTSVSTLLTSSFCISLLDNEVTSLASAHRLFLIFIRSDLISIAPFFKLCTLSMKLNLGKRFFC